MEVDQCNVALDDFCSRLLSFAAAAAGHDNDERKEINAIQKARINENCFYDKDDEDEFWTWATRLSAYNSKANSSSVNGVVALADIIKFADELCVLTYEDYARTSRELVNVLIKRMVVVVNEVDGILVNSITMRVVTSLVYDGEMHLRSLYLSFKRDELEGGASFSKYISSRQQCIYACVCFVITFFAVYDSILMCDTNNFEWFCGVVMQGGSVLEDDSRR